MRSAYFPELPPEGPRFTALAAAITSDIERGRLRPGERLPGSRSLAKRLGLGRNTVVRAMRELEAEGWLQATAGSGLRVRERLEQSVVPQSTPPQLGFSVPEAPTTGRRRTNAPKHCHLQMLGGQPDLRLLPLTELSRAYRRVLRGRGRKLVGYGDPCGEPLLREVLAKWLAETRGLSNAPERLLITRGSQMALYLLAQTLLRRGDRIAVEALGYAPAWRAFQSAGAALVPVPVDRDGMQADAIPDDVRAVYLTPHHQYPTGALLSAERRIQLLAWAAERRIPILEDDYDHEYHYDTSPVLPLAAMDRNGVVVSIGTLSKAFAPGVRLGWIYAPPELLAVLTERRLMVDRQGDRVVEQAIAELLQDGIIARHMRKTRRIYAARRDALIAGLPRLPVTPHIVGGGMAIWCESHVDADAWATRAEARGLFFTAGSAYTLDGQASPHVRLGFAGLSVEEMGEALQIAEATA